MSTYTNNPLRGYQAGDTTAKSSFYVTTTAQDWVKKMYSECPNGEHGMLRSLSPDLNCDGRRL